MMCGYYFQKWFYNEIQTIIVYMGILAVLLTGETEYTGGMLLMTQLTQQD